MKLIFYSLIEQLNASVFVLLLMLIGFYYVVFKVAEWLGKSEERESNTTKTLNKLEAKIDILPELKGKIELIYNSTLPANKKMIESHSPIPLTKIGKEVAQKIKAEDIIDKGYINIKDTIKANHTDIFNQNAYDIQEIIFTYFSDRIETHLKADKLNSIKTEAYNRGVIVEDLYKILAVIFRDKLLRELKKPVSDIDKYDPNKSQ